MNPLQLLLPSTTVLIDSPLSSAEVQQAVAGTIEPRPSFSFLPSPGVKPFRGKIEGSRFTAVRQITYRNSFLPVVIGEIEPTGTGTIVRLEMRMQRAIQIFMTFWFGFLLIAGVGLMTSVTRSGRSDAAGAVVPLGMLAFGIGLVNFSFRPEAKKAERHFIALLQGAVKSEELPNVRQL